MDPTPPTPPTPQEEKTALRARVRHGLSLVPPAEAAAWSMAICRRIEEAQFYRGISGNGAIMLYSPLAGEVDVRPLAEAAARRGLRVCIPRSGWEQRELIPVPVNSLHAGLVAGRHGISEPPSTTEPIAVAALELVVVPGIAFDEAGGRIGRGAGFYDRFLARPDLRAIACGVAFEIQIVDHVPVERWDARLPVIATEKRLITRPAPASDRPGDRVS